MKKKSAWLVAWEASTERRLSQIEGPRIIAFFDGRKSSTTMREIVFGLFLASNALNHEEKLYYGLANEGKKIIQRDNFDSVQCGLNPWIVARWIEDLEMSVLANRDFHFRWMQPVFTFPRREGAMPVRKLELREERVGRT